jgi:tRNA U34 2-thiouridine synthase MnmA/TrmU
MRVKVKIRRRHKLAPVLIERVGEDEIVVTFDQLQRDITPSQAAVFVDVETVVTGGWITRNCQCRRDRNGRISDETRSRS